MDRETKNRHAKEFQQRLTKDKISISENINDRQVKRWGYCLLVVIIYSIVQCVKEGLK